MSRTEEDTDIYLLLRYPLITKEVKKRRISYKGCIDVNEHVYKLEVTESPDHTFQFQFFDDLKQCEEEFKVTAANIHPKNIIAYLDALKVFIENKNLSIVPINHSEAFLHVLHEYSEFTRFYFNLKSNYLAEDLSEITLTMHDEVNREHFLVIRINYSGKEIFEIAEYNLPIEKERFKPSSSLRIVYDQFVSIISDLQPFFSLMEVLDSNCRVLDPTETRWCFKYRRIWLDENLSVIITVDPFKMCQLPEIKFLGPEKSVQTYRNTLNENLENWDVKGDTFTEILKLIGLSEFPQKPKRDIPQEDVLWKTGDCSICYSSRLNNKLPEIVCNNSFCENYYHVECLYEWLMSVNSRRVFAQVLGQCPNCEKNITCPIPN